MIRCLIFITAICSWAVCAGQGFMKSLPKYDFINYEKNIIEFPGDTGNMRNFYTKMDSLVLCREGKINILHIGGSHVQADMFTNRVRRNLDSLNLDFKSSRGLIFPFKIAKTNNPLNYKVTYTGKWSSSRILKRNKNIELGVMGIAVQSQSADASMHIRLNRDSTERWLCTNLKIIGYSDSTYSYPVIVDDKTKQRWAGAYNPAEDVYEFQFAEAVDSFTIAIEQSDAVFHPFTMAGILVENRDLGITYNAVGINGASVPSWLNCERFQKELPLVKPDLVVFGIGINDAVSPNFSDSVFKANYTKLIERIKTISPNCSFLFITNNDSYKRSNGAYVVNKNGTKVQRAFKELASKNDGAVWDQFEIMGGLKSMAKWEKAGLARKDKIHFTREGYELLGDMFYNALIKSYLSH